MIFDRNYKTRTIRDWTICPIYTGNVDDCGLYECIIGMYRGKKFRTGEVLRLEAITSNCLILNAKDPNGNYSKYKLYFDNHFEPTFRKKKQVHGWDYDYIYGDSNDRFRIVGFLDRGYNRPWRTTPVTHTERVKNYILAHTESGTVYKLGINKEYRNFYDETH